MAGRRSPNAGTVRVARQNRTKQSAFGLRGLILTLFVSLGVFAPPTTAAPTSRSERVRIAEQQFTRAEKLRTALEGKPRAARKEAEYLQIIRTYRRVYDVAPFTATAARALRGRAELYHEMGQSFGTKYFEQAIATYRFLLKEYPQGSHRFEALFTIAQIQRADLNDLKAAQETFAEFLKRYPESKLAAQARQALEEIRKQQEQAKAVPQPAPPPAGARVQVNNIRFWNTPNYTRVVIDLEGEIQYQAGRLSKPDRIFFDLLATRLNSPLVGKTFDVESGLLKRIRVAENRDGITRVVLEMGGEHEHSVFSLPDPFRLVVDVRARNGATKKAEAETAAKGAAGSQPAPSETASTKTTPPLQPPTPPKPTSQGQQTLTRALGLKINRIVIDPGHGGHDTGTIGPTGFMEKDLVLDVARRLGQLLNEKIGAEVVYTREDDTFVPLENRTALANEKQADLFLSLHANSSRDPNVRGVETFILNFTTDQEALEVAARENALSQKSVHELQDIVRKITRNEKVEESRELARELQANLHKELRRASRYVQNRGVKQAPFVVLVGASMPSVLSEIAFLSNTRDEGLLKTPRWRQRVAEALFTAISKYLENLNSVSVARVPANEAASTQPPD